MSKKQAIKEAVDAFAALLLAIVEDTTCESDDEAISKTTKKKATKKKASKKKTTRKKTTRKKAEPEEDEDMGFEDGEEDEDEDSEYTKEDVIKAFKAYVKGFGEVKKGRAAAKKVLKKFDAESVDEIDEADYEEVIEILEE